MGLLTFKGGIHPNDGKSLAKDKAIVEVLPEGDLVFPLSQHIGAPAAPIVKAGDHVLKGQKIAEAGGFERWMSMLNYQYNNEPEAMRDIMMIYGALRKPVMVLFLTDGRLSSDWEIEEILIKTSRFPIYWQFVGLHGEEYGILERLQEIDGRRSDNAAFLKLDDIDDISDNTLYENLLHNLEGWLREIQYKHILEP